MTLPPRAPNVHASCVQIAGTGVLIRGAARSGKSSLALMLLRRAEVLGLAAALVADDQVLLSPSAQGLEARAPATIRGLIEISGVGLVHLPTSETATIGLVVDLVDRAGMERLPEQPTVGLFGTALRRIFQPERQAVFSGELILGLLAGNWSWNDAEDGAAVQTK